MSAVSAFLHKLWVGNGPIVPHHVGAPLPQTPVKAEAGYHMPPDEPIDIPVYKFIGKLNIHMTDGTSIGYHRELKEGETADTYEAFAKWVMRPRGANSIQDSFYNIEHSKGHTLVRYSTIRRVEITYTKELQ